MSNKTRIGIYGGTFNPPHIGHIRAAQSFVKEAVLDKLLIMPTFLPPHKSLDSEFSSVDRLNMCKIAFFGVEKTEVSDYEIKRGGKSYTALTLKDFYSEENELYFLCGTDMFLTLDSWYMPNVIFELATICCIRRENDTKNDKKLLSKAREYEKNYGARILQIHADVTEASSTEIREKIKNGDDVSHLLTKELIDYVSDKGLYK